MNKDYIIIQKELLQYLINRIDKLEKEIENMQPKEEQPLKNQISIDEYTKTLKKENKNGNGRIS